MQRYSRCDGSMAHRGAAAFGAVLLMSFSGVLGSEGSWVYARRWWTPAEGRLANHCNRLLRASVVLPQENGDCLVGVSGPVRGSGGASLWWFDASRKGFIPFPDLPDRSGIVYAAICGGRYDVLAATDQGIYNHHGRGWSKLAPTQIAWPGSHGKQDSATPNAVGECISLVGRKGGTVWALLNLDRQLVLASFSWQGEGELAVPLKVLAVGRGWAKVRPDGKHEYWVSTAPKQLLADHQETVWLLRKSGDLEVRGSMKSGSSSEKRVIAAPMGEFRIGREVGPALFGRDGRLWLAYNGSRGPVIVERAPDSEWAVIEPLSQALSGSDVTCLGEGAGLYIGTRDRGAWVWYKDAVKPHEIAKKLPKMTPRRPHSAALALEQAEPALARVDAMVPTPRGGMMWIAACNRLFFWEVED